MSKVTKAAVGLMIATLLSKILSFGRELALASTYGASSISDAYLVALNIPLVIFASIGAALATSYIPLYCDIRENKSEKESIEFTNNIINILTIVSIVVAVIGLIFTKPIVKLFAVGFEGETLRLAINFTRVLFLGVGAIALNNIFASYLQIKENFIIPGLSVIPYNIIIIVSIILSAKYNIYILVVGTLIAMVCQVLFQLPFAYKKGYKYSVYTNIKDEYIKKMLYLVTPVFIGVSVNQINALIDRTLASTLMEGSISALNYANKLNSFVMGMFVFSIATVMYPTFSRLASQNDTEAFNISVKKSVNTMILIIMPISIGAMVLSDPIVSVLFERGSFDARAANMTSTALFFYSIGILGFALRDVLARVFYALKDTKTPMINASLAVGLNIVLNLILVRFMSYGGLALATSISALVCIVLLFRSLGKKIGYFGQKEIIVVGFKSLLSALVMGGAARLSYIYLNNILGSGSISQVIGLGISILVGAIVYGILVYLFKIEELNVLTDMIKSKVFKK